MEQTPPLRIDALATGGFDSHRSGEKHRLVSVQFRPPLGGEGGSLPGFFSSWYMLSHEKLRAGIVAIYPLVPNVLQTGEVLISISPTLTPKLFPEQIRQSQFAGSH